MVAVIAVAHTRCQADCYSVEVIQGPICPPFFDHTPTFATGLTADGIVVGYYWQCVQQDRNEGFIWTAKDGMSTIPRPAGVITLGASDINASRQVAVSMTIPGLGLGFLAWLYDGGRFTFLGLPPGGNYSAPTAINSTGDVVGWWGNNLIGNPEMHAFHSHRGVMTDIGALLDGPQNRAWDINDVGQIVGDMGNITGTVGVQQSFLWQGGAIKVLSPLTKGLNSHAEAINNSGYVVGSSRIANPSGSGTVARACLWKDGLPVNLGILAGGIHSNANAINENNIIVGSSTYTASGSSFGFVWQNGIMTNLNDLVVTDLPIVITSGTKINNTGQILANGSLGSKRVGFLLTPLPLNPTDLSGDCRVGPADLMMLIQSWGPVTERTPTPAADIDKNQIVNGIDLALLLGAWQP